MGGILLFCAFLLIRGAQKEQLNAVMKAVHALKTEQTLKESIESLDRDMEDNLMK